jgi:hypothetical protein
MSHQVSIFAGIMSRTTSQIQDVLEPDLWVMDPKVRYIDEVEPRPEMDLYRVRGVEGVDWATRLYKGQVRARLDDGNFRQVLEETGMSFKLEVEMIRAARELDLLTTPYAFDPEEARWMADAGADIVVAHLNTTTKGLIGVTSAPSLDEAVERVQAIADAAYEVNPEVLVLCHGGPIAEPEDAQYVLDRTIGVVGFYGASSMERLPVETAIAANARRFKQLTFRPR